MSLIEKLDELVKKLEEVKTEAPALTVTPLDTKGLSPEAEAALAPQFKDLVWPRPERKTIFLSAIAKSEAGIQKAAEHLLEQVERLHLCGVLLGHLAPLSTIRLADGYTDINGTFVPAKQTGWVVFIFPVVKWEFEPSYYTELLDIEVFQPEGSIGTKVFE